MLCDNCTKEIAGEPTNMGYGMIWCGPCVADPDRAQRVTLKAELAEVDVKIASLNHSKSLLDARKREIESAMRKLKPEPKA